MIYKHLLLPIVSVLLLGACSTMSPPQTRSQMGNLLLAEPASASVRSQIAIARYNQILSQAVLKQEERAELLFERGLMYDEMGLSRLAQYDFSQALKLKPDLAEAYNSIGIHYTLQRQFIEAYESFDSTLDIDPDYDFAFLNRGIALYYGGRPDLAVRDLGHFASKDISDPFRALWQYFAESDLNPQSAASQLREARKVLNEDNWATGIVDFYLGTMSEDALLNSLIRGVSSERELNDRLCEAYFYLGKYHSAKGRKGMASSYFKLALSTNVYKYVEHRYARLELTLLRERAQKAAQAN